MNNTQKEVIEFIFVLFFSFSEEDIFLKYIAPIILNNSSSRLNTLLSFIIVLISILTALASFLILYRILKNMEWVKINRPNIFKKFLSKIVITAIISFIVFGYLRLKLL
jgi:hypothetical protein